MEERLEIMSAIQAETIKKTNEIDTEHRITEEFAELAKTKRATFDVPYSETDPLR